MEVRFRKQTEAIAYPPKPEDNDIVIDLAKAPAVVNMVLSADKNGEPMSAAITMHQEGNVIYFWGKSLTSLTQVVEPGKSKAEALIVKCLQGHVIPQQGYICPECKGFPYFFNDKTAAQWDALTPTGALAKMKVSKLGDWDQLKQREAK